MHAAIHELLSLRDGEPVDTQVIDHIEHCARCGAELSRLKHLQRRLQALEPHEPPAAAWDAINARLHAPRDSTPRSRIPWAIAASVIVVFVSGWFIRGQMYSHEDAPVVAASPPQTTSLDDLVAQSRELDDILQVLPGRPAVERVALAATIDTIEQRVQWLDQQLAYAPDTGLNEAQAYQLWRERVDLMDSLVKVRYAEGAQMSF